MSARIHYRVIAISVVAAMAALTGAQRLRAAAQPVDLDGRADNGAESEVRLEIVGPPEFPSFPPTVRNTVENRTSGDGYTFRYPAAGPGGFSSNLPPGTERGVGVVWTWQSSQTIYSYTGSGCTDDICFSKVSGPDFPPSNEPAWGVPGRTIVPGQVTVSSGSLTLNLLTFFSPPRLLLRVTSSVAPLANGQLAYTTTYQNPTGQASTVNVVSPAGCCPEPGMLNCDGTCVDYREDARNCGECGNVCGEGEFCGDGYCQVECPEGEVRCYGEYCADLGNDRENCGECGNFCSEGFDCINGACTYSCPAGQTACETEGGWFCANFEKNRDHCGGCYNSCDEGMLCNRGTCDEGCGEGDVACFEAYCANLSEDSDDCGECGLDCNEDFVSGCELYYCNYGNCSCDPGGVTGPAPQGSSQAPGPAPVEGPIEAPVCQTTTQLIPAGESRSFCEVSSFLPKEVASVLKACGDEIPDGSDACENGDPSSSGTFMKYEPDFDRPYPAPGVLVTPVSVSVVETIGNGNGLLQPGETGRVFIAVLNAGTDSLTDVIGELSSPPTDVSDDGVFDPVQLEIVQGNSQYPPLPGVVVGGSAGCAGPFSASPPRMNSTAFVILIPADFPEDVAVPLDLQLSSGVAYQGGGFGNGTATVPLALAVGSAEADLSASIVDAPDPVSEGADFQYSIRVRNDGRSAYPFEVKVINDLPPTAKFRSLAAPGWNCAAPPAGSGGTLTCTMPSPGPIGPLPPIEVVAGTDACSGAAVLEHAARVEGPLPDPQPLDNFVVETTTVSDPAPVVTLTQPAACPSSNPRVHRNVPVSWLRTGAAEIERERVFLNECLLWDGATFGDLDGVLTDELPLTLAKSQVCQAMKRCGLSFLYLPKIRVESTDACGRVAEDEVIYRRSLFRKDVCRQGAGDHHSDSDSRSGSHSRDRQSRRVAGETHTRRGPARDRQ